jgi:hypothetical protein
MSEIGIQVRDGVERFTLASIEDVSDDSNPTGLSFYNEGKVYPLVNQAEGYESAYAIADDDRLQIGCDGNATRPSVNASGITPFLYNNRRESVVELSAIVRVTENNYAGWAAPNAIGIGFGGWSWLEDEWGSDPYYDGLFPKNSLFFVPYDTYHGSAPSVYLLMEDDVVDEVNKFLPALDDESFTLRAPANVSLVFNQDFVIIFRAAIATDGTYALIKFNVLVNGVRVGISDYKVKVLLSTLDLTKPWNLWFLPAVNNNNIEITAIERRVY